MIQLRYLTLICLLLLVHAIVPAQSVYLKLHHLVNNQPLVLDSATYHNEAGENFTISKFRYYISNIVLYKKGKMLKCPGYFLIDEAEQATRTIALKNVPVGQYDSIRFMVGVDSARNCSGAQTGGLDPLKGMFWTWKSGYIFMKLEGHSAASSLPSQLIEYHIGGYRAPANCIRTITLPLKKRASTIDIDVAIDQLFSGELNIRNHPSITGIDHAEQMADRFPQLFTITP